MRWTVLVVLGLDYPQVTHGFEDNVHEAIHLLAVDETLALVDTHGQLGYHGQVLLEVVADDLAQAVIVVECLDLLDLAEGVEGVVV